MASSGHLVATNNPTITPHSDIGVPHGVMSEELIRKGLTDHGLKIGNYEFYPVGDTTLNQLKKYRIIPNRDYGKYGSRKPDALLVDRRNKNRIKIVLVIEHKDVGKFTSKADKKASAQQCNDLCQELKADIGIATDNSSFIWINPNHPDPNNTYTDRTTNKSRSYAVISDEDGNAFLKPFLIDQREDETELTKLNVKTRSSLDSVALVRKSLSPTNSQLIKEVAIDPTRLARQIWQDVWSVSGATPEKCLYTFVELFIFKYLSDLNILDEDDKGNKINFRDIYQLAPEVAFKNYSYNAREYLKKMFPPDPFDKTTIINGTVLNPEVPEHSTVFYKILKKFHDFGELKNIDPSFKSRVFEDFMKESISKRNWGQYFTPRNIVDAIIEISDIDKLPEGAEVCDPACGVGGFILEPMRVKPNGVKFYYDVIGNRIKPRLRFHGFDKGFEKEEQLTIILAKANMLIFISELLKHHHPISTEFANLFNSIFKLLSTTILGTLAHIEPDKYDLILTNPPYVTSGSSNYKDAIKNDGKLREFYRVNALGVEGLFLEWIIRSLKPGAKAFAIIPDGILNRLNDSKLRAFIKDECFIDGIISLPVNAFYRNPKKTYILAITKKSEKDESGRKAHVQTDPVFTYLVSEIGETLDVKRFLTPDKNDLKEMVSLFNQFKGSKATFTATGRKRCKIQPVTLFDPTHHWSVDRWWTEREKIDLGIAEERTLITLGDFTTQLEGEKDNLQSAIDRLKAMDEEMPHPKHSVEISLSDKEYFQLFIGKRVLKKDIFYAKSKGAIPVYSANVKTPFGTMKDSNIKDFTRDNVLWGIDGDFEFNVIRRNVPFRTTDHCGCIKILRDDVDPDYLYYYLTWIRSTQALDRELRASLGNMKRIKVKFPVKTNPDGTPKSRPTPTGNIYDLDLESQRRIAEFYKTFEEVKTEIVTGTRQLATLEIPPLA
jgi:type I restriction-modification system DNA methylase subunit